MLEIFLIVLLGLIIYFFLQTRKGMSKIDSIYNKENSTEMKTKQLEQQKRLIKNKTFRWKTQQNIPMFDGRLKYNFRLRKKLYYYFMCEHQL